MALPGSPAPARNPAGYSTDWPYGPLANYGLPNPLDFHTDMDDFNASDTVANAYTTSAGGAGTVAYAAGDGGLLLFTTAGAATNFESIQRPITGFTMPQSATANKKFFFLCRLQLGDVVASALLAGMISTNATPFTSIADGVWFSKASGGTVLNLNSAIGSVLTTVAIPLPSYNLVNATNIDLGFEVSTDGDIFAYVSANMIGYQPQSGTGSTLPTRGKVARITAPTLTTANLSPTFGVQTSAAAAKTMTLDAWMAAKER